jgi:hypothetical protein
VESARPGREAAAIGSKEHSIVRVDQCHDLGRRPRDPFLEGVAGWDVGGPQTHLDFGLVLVIGFRDEQGPVS